MSPHLNMQVQGDVALESGMISFHNLANGLTWVLMHVEAESGLGFEGHQTRLFSLWIARKPFKSNIPHKKIRGTMICHCACDSLF